MMILEQLMARVLSKSLAKMSLIIPVRLHQLNHGRIRVLGNVPNQVPQGSWQFWKRF